jgi:hypothetical protein
MKLRRSAAQAAAAQQQLALLHEARSKGVRLYRANPRPWPDGIGAWYRAEDWTDSGELIATGEARARALDWWANDRAKGRPCPPLAGVPPRVVTTKVSSVTTSEAVTTPSEREQKEAVTTSAEPAPTGGRSKPKRDRAQYMRDRRQAEADAREKVEREREAVFVKETKS